MIRTVLLSLLVSKARFVRHLIRISSGRPLKCLHAMDRVPECDQYDVTVNYRTFRKAFKLCFRYSSRRSFFYSLVTMLKFYLFILHLSQLSSMFFFFLNINSFLSLWGKEYFFIKRAEEPVFFYDYHDKSSCCINLRIYWSFALMFIVYCQTKVHLTNLFCQVRQLSGNVNYVCNFCCCCGKYI